MDLHHVGTAALHHAVPACLSFTKFVGLGGGEQLLGGGKDLIEGRIGYAGRRSSRPDFRVEAKRTYAGTKQAHRLLQVLVLVAGEQWVAGWACIRR